MRHKRTTDWFCAGGVEVNRYQEAGFTVHLVQSDMWVVFDGVGAVFVRAPGSMAGQLRGVAGNFNEKQGDDMVMPSGEPAVRWLLSA